jgi:hypothetical protein
MIVAARRSRTKYPEKGSASWDAEDTPGLSRCMQMSFSSLPTASFLVCPKNKYGWEKTPTHIYF